MVFIPILTEPERAALPSFPSAETSIRAGGTGGVGRGSPAVPLPPKSYGVR